MANDDIPRGLIPLNLNSKNSHYYRVSTAADIYLGQPVTQTAAGFVIGNSGRSLVQLLGVAIGFAGPNKTGLAGGDPFLDVSDLPSPPSNTGDHFVLVADDPQQEFVIQEDSGGTALTQAAAGAAVLDLWRGSDPAQSGSADTGWATLEIDASSIVTTTAAAYQLLRYHDVINADGTENVTGDFAKWIVKILHHQKRGGSIASAGIV